MRASTIARASITVLRPTAIAIATLGVLAASGAVEWWHPFLVVHACGRIALDASPLQALALAAGPFVIWSGWRAFGEARRARRATAATAQLPARPVAGWPNTWVVPGEQLFAFTAGWLAPRVFISEAALDRLSADQRAAVLAHEHCHRRRRDPLRRLGSAMLAEALFFLPGSRQARRALDEACEITADHAALTAAGGRRGPLAGALLAFDSAGPAGVGVNPARVDRLVDGDSAPPARLRFVAHLAAGGMLILLMSAFGAMQVAVDHALRVCVVGAAGLAMCAAAVAVSLAGPRRRP